jgi:hypothetical protein
LWITWQAHVVAARGKSPVADLARSGRSLCLKSHPTPAALRAAVLAYRAARATGALDHPAHLAAKAAVLALHPTLSDTQASHEAVHAVAYASSLLSKWFWAPVEGR